MIFNVLEHVLNPNLAIKNLSKILKKNGKIVGSTPFLFRVHGAPKDYSRFTKDHLIELLKSSNFKDIEIIEGLLRDEARELNRGFFSRLEKNRPFITAKMAIGLDGGIALNSGKSKWITSEISRKDVHKLRASNEAILTGTGTILKDNPSLTSRDSGYDINDVKQPLRVVIDRNNYLNGKENIFSSEAKTLVFTTKNSKIKSKNCEICVMSKNDLEDLNNIMNYLAKEKSINTLMIESGSILLDALMAQELIDELILYQAPKLLGKDRNTFSKFGQNNQKLSTIGFTIRDMENLGEDLKITLSPK